ncbi:putative F-box protein At3g25750 [Carex rostrata]
MSIIPYIAEPRRMIRDEKSLSSSSDWPDLPPDLLRLIYRKLYDTFDFINFRAVCKGWFAAAPLSEHPPQFPFLLKGGISEFKLHSLQSGKTRIIQVPEPFYKVFTGQSQGYLVTYNVGYDYTSVTVLNPFTRDEISLPFDGFTCFRPLHIGLDDMVIDMWCYEGRFVGFWKNEESEWALKGRFPGRVEAYHRGRVFFSNFLDYSTTIMDLNTGNRLEVMLPSNSVKDDFFCLGEGAGAFLGIQRRFHSCTGYEYSSVEKCWFEVYQLDEKQNPPCWVKLSDIGNLMIFLDSDNSGFCLSASDFDGIKGNCIYFTSCRSERVDDIGMLIGLYELGKLRSKVIGQFESKGTWIVPNVY